MKRKGFTLIELLAAMAIFAVVLGIVGNYLAEQNTLTRTNQARSELQDRIRIVMQVVTQDLQMAGASRYSDASGNINTSVSLASCTYTQCLIAADGGVKDSFQVQYLTSLQDASNACRRVIFDFSGNTLRRSDVACSSPANPQPLADDLLALDIVYLCSNGSRLNGYPDETRCPTGAAYPRSALVSVVGQSRAPVAGVPSSSYPTSSGQTVACPAGFLCYAMSQEVRMPSLKDQ